VALIVASCGGAGRGHSSAASTRSNTAQRTGPASRTTKTSATPALQTIRCPHRLALPARGKYAGQQATVFIVNASPKRSGCGFASGWMAQWVKSGAQPGGYAVGRLAGIRCDEPLLPNSGPLGKKYARYGGVIHCDQITGSAPDPQAELDSDSAGIWGYYGKGAVPASHHPAGPAAGPAIAGATLSKAVAKELGRDGVTADSVTCSALARKRGATATCRFSGKDADVGSGKVHGTAQITIQDSAGRRALDSFQVNGTNGQEARGTGYPFDPETGRVL
jgi:hypothetical protein